MTEDELKNWLVELVKADLDYQSIEQWGVDPATERERWITEAGSCLSLAFRSTDVVWQRWTRALAKLEDETRYLEALSEAQGVVAAAHSQVASGRLRSIMETARAETAGEVLDQAAALHAKGYLIAAAVVAGGALETHLRHLCQRHELVWDGEGSINSYNAAITTARNAGRIQILNAAYANLVNGWANIRNDGAHTPTLWQERGHSKRDVQRMIDGVRDVLAKWP